jgi:hypothetical protein
MVVWGGWNGFALLDTGGIYDPVANSWVATSLSGAPSARRGFAAVWTGSLLIVYGGENSISAAIDGTGGRFDPSTNTWTATSTTGAPIFSLSTLTKGVWSGDRLIVWGEGGGRYDPVTNAWSGVSVVGAPAVRRRHSLVWSGSRMIVWGGDFTLPVDDGALYDPALDSTP